jgi:Cu/Ag efflux pump CusA
MPSSGKRFAVSRAGLCRHKVVVMAGLLTLLLGHGTGSEVMTRIATPMVGGMVTAPLLSMLVVPAAW